MKKRISKIDLFKSVKKSERRMHAAKIDWHLRALSEAHEANSQRSIDRHETVIRESELQLHKLRKFA